MWLSGRVVVCACVCGLVSCAAYFLRGITRVRLSACVPLSAFVPLTAFVCGLLRVASAS